MASNRPKQNQIRSTTTDADDLKNARSAQIAQSGKRSEAARDKHQESGKTAKDSSMQKVRQSH
jgi:hypothetical protein